LHDRHLLLGTMRRVIGITGRGVPMMTRPPATTAGFPITVRGRRIYLVDVEPTSDPGISAAEAREIVVRLRQ
jgi:hypothetical protein